MRRSYWLFSICLAAVWAVVLVLAFATRAAAAVPLLYVAGGYAFAWAAASIARLACPPPRKWLPEGWTDQRGPVRRLRTWTTLTIGLVIGWAIPIVITFASGRTMHPILLLFAGFTIGWIACTIAREVYPPAARWLRTGSAGPTLA